MNKRTEDLKDEFYEKPALACTSEFNVLGLPVPPPSSGSLS